MNKFCHNCGKQMPSVEAKFCPYCGTSLLSLSSKPTPPAQHAPAPAPTWARGDDDDDDDYIDRIQRLNVRINKLEVEVSRPPVVEPEKLGQIAARQTLDTSEFRSGGPTLTPEQIKEQFAREAGSRVANQRTHSLTVNEN